MAFPFVDTEFVRAFSAYKLTLFLLATPIDFGPLELLFYHDAFKPLRVGSANMDVLVALATSISFFFNPAQVITRMKCIAERNASSIVLRSSPSPNTAFNKLMDLASDAARL